MWCIALERCAGEVAIAKKKGGESPEEQDGAAVSTLPDAPTKRLSRVNLNDLSSSSNDSHEAAQHLDACEASALKGLSGYLHSLLLGAAIKDCSLICPGAVLPDFMVVPPFAIVEGSPARIVGELPESAAEEYKLQAERMCRRRVFQRAAPT